MALPPAGGRNKKDRLRGLFFSCGFSEAPTGLPVKGCGARGLPPPLASRQSGASELRPPTSCLPCVRGGAERMRSGGVVGAVQEKEACNRLPAPIRHPQPLSQGLRPCQLPFSIAGVSAETPLRHRSAGRARSDGRNHVPPVNPLLFRRRTGDGASSEKKRSPAADAGLGCSKNRPLRARTGGSGGHFALGTKAPRRPFSPLSAGGKWTNAPQNRFCGGPVSFDRLGRRTQRLPAA